MMLFYNARFTRSRVKCRDTLLKMADLLRLGDAKDHDETAKAFIQNVQDGNWNAMNASFEEAMSHYLHTTDLITGMFSYCKKFGIEMDAVNMTDDQSICFIAEHSEKISRQLMKMGL